MKLINSIVKGFEATDLDPLPLFNETMQMLSDPNGIYIEAKMMTAICLQDT